jgi:hypothetical protein
MDLLVADSRRGARFRRASAIGIGPLLLSRRWRIRFGWLAATPRREISPRGWYA